MLLFQFGGGDFSGLGMRMADCLTLSDSRGLSVSLGLEVVVSFRYSRLRVHVARVQGCSVAIRVSAGPGHELAYPGKLC